MRSSLRVSLSAYIMVSAACSPTQAPAASANAPTTPAPLAAANPPPADNGRPKGWSAPEVVVAPSSFHGVHGVVIDAQGRLLAGTVVGGEMWEVDRNTGTAKVFIPAPEGESDGIAVGPKGELAWTSYSQGILRYRENDAAPIRELAKDLPGINSIAFDKRNGKLYAAQVFLGDALWQIDVAQKTPPRLIRKDLGGFNSFQVGSDGMLYGPLWFKGQLVKINPLNGQTSVLNSDFKTPAAAALDGKGNLWAIDTKLGTLDKVELASGKKTEIAKLATSLDNLTFGPDGLIYVTNMADNSVQTVDPVSGAIKTLTSGKLATPGGMRLDGDTLYIADVFAFRAVDTKTGVVRDIYRAQDSKLEYPGAVGIGGKLIALISWSYGTVQLLDRATQQDIETLHGFKTPSDALPLEDGSLLVLEVGTGSLLRSSGEHFADRSVVTKDLVGPNQMILGKDGAVYLTEANGRLSKIDLSTGQRTSVVEQLSMPEGIAQTPWGTFIVAETLKQRLVEIDPKDGSSKTVAENLPIGLVPNRPGPPLAYLATGVAITPDGTVYATADLNQSLLRIRPQR